MSLLMSFHPHGCCGNLHAENGFKQTKVEVGELPLLPSQMVILCALLYFTQLLPAVCQYSSRHGPGRLAAR